MITALVAGTSLVSVLAWLLPGKVSLTLAAILTAILLPLALVKLRRSAKLAWMTSVMLGMAWRGEDWKNACLEAEQRLSQLPPQCLQLLPKTVSSGRGSGFLCDGSAQLHLLEYFDDVGAQRLSPGDRFDRLDFETGRPVARHRNYDSPAFEFDYPIRLPDGDSNRFAK